MLLVAAGLSGLALWWRSGWLFGVVTVTLLVVIGLGVFIPQLQLFGPYVCVGQSGKRQVALTFDDGPDPRSTPALLELLRIAQVPAAFFCIGRQVAAHPALTAQIVQDGHLLANHTYTHSKTTNLFSMGRLRAELAQTQTAITAATGTTPGYFRPPMGLSNPRIFAVARALGLSVIGWTVRGLDTQITQPERVVARIARGLRPGAIILLHDGNIPPERLVATVESLLDILRDQDYEVVRLDKVLK